MAEYSVETCKELQEIFHSTELCRPMRIEKYDPGTELVYDITGVSPAYRAKASLLVEKFVGGGFAGQVYKVKVLSLDTTKGAVEGIEVGKSYAVKVLIPPSRMSKIFRDLLYAIGFQGPFQLQTNPAAARSGALWQKFIKAASQIKFDGQNVVNDVHATFVDHYMGSCGEISGWVEGRTWRLEVDDNLDALKLWKHGREIKSEMLGSPEYRAKHRFMHDFVDMLGEIGAYEFARQYEWSTCKSQPNCLKLSSTDNDPERGLMAVDFRAGLTLLPFLPMSPGDFMLIAKGIKRGSLVQFDRGDINKLQAYIEKHPSHFEHLKDAFEELKIDEEIYRNSVPDITHNHVRLLYDGKLWSTILNSAVTGWKTKNFLDEEKEAKLRSSKFLTLIFVFIGMIPFAGEFLRRLWGRKDWRKHYHDLCLNKTYFVRAIKGRACEKAIGWHREGRLSAGKALEVGNRMPLFIGHLLISWLPIGLHKFAVDPRYRKEKYFYIFVRPVKLYFNADFREQWLRDMVADGRENHLVTKDDSETILSQLDEPFIQKYLKSLAVHVCTLPVTQVVSVMIAVIYVLMHPDMPRSQSWGIGVGIIALFQVVPISPGSICRGLYTLYMVIKDRSFKDYNIAIFLSFFKYVGYLAFPIQMAYRYPTLARFMAGHWATEAVHIVPVFGERGALLEHWVFCLFYNWPLTIRKRIGKRMALRAGQPSRYWHILPIAAITAGLMGWFDHLYIKDVGQLPVYDKMWWVSVIVPLLAIGSVSTLFANGTGLAKRIISAAVCGVLCACIYTVINISLAVTYHGPTGQFVALGIWRVFAFTLLATAGAIGTELKLPDPDLKK